MSETEEVHWKHGRYYSKLVRQLKLSRPKVVQMMRKKLKTTHHFRASMFSDRWPERNELRANAELLERRTYGEYGGYTDEWFVFQDDKVYFGSRSSDPIWDAYTYQYDQNLSDPPTLLPFKKAIMMIFDEIQEPEVAEPSTQE